MLTGNPAPDALKRSYAVWQKKADEPAIGDIPLRWLRFFRVSAGVKGELMGLISLMLAKNPRVGLDPTRDAAACEWGAD